MSQRQRYCGCGGSIGIFPLDLPEMLHDCGRLGLTSPMAIFSAHTHRHRPRAELQPAHEPQVTCFDSPATTSARGPLAWVHHELVLIDQSQLRQRQRELHASHEQSLPDSRLSC